MYFQIRLDLSYFYFEQGHFIEFKKKIVNNLLRQNKHKTKIPPPLTTDPATLDQT